MSHVRNPLALLRNDQGSAVIEFVLVYPVALVMILLAFSDANSVQMRQLSVTLIAREIGRGIEIGLTPREINNALSVLCDDLGLEGDPNLAFERTDANKAVLTVNYKGERFATLISTRNSDELWRQWQSDRGSTIPLFVGLVALLMGTCALTMNLSATNIAAIRANDLSSSLAIAVAGSVPSDLAEQATNFAQDWPSELRTRVEYEVGSTDTITATVRLCYRYELIWQWLSEGTQLACSERKARLIPGY